MSILITHDEMVGNCDMKSATMIPYELNNLDDAGMIDAEQYMKLYHMSQSRDKEMRALALAIVNPLRNQRIQNEKDKKKIDDKAV